MNLVSKSLFVDLFLSSSNIFRKMAAVEIASLSNGYNGAQVNGHSYEDENDDKAYEEKPYSQKPQTKAVPQKVRV